MSLIHVATARFAQDLQQHLDGLVSGSFPVLLDLFRHLQKTNDVSILHCCGMVSAISPNVAPCDSRVWNRTLCKS